MVEYRDIHLPMKWRPKTLPTNNLISSQKNLVGFNDLTLNTTNDRVDGTVTNSNQEYTQMKNTI
jgi:hypothetical protein